jgi:hypothetical protein
VNPPKGQAAAIVLATANLSGKADREGIPNADR